MFSYATPFIAQKDICFFRKDSQKMCDIKTIEFEIFENEYDLVWISYLIILIYGMTYIYIIEEKVK